MKELSVEEKAKRYDEVLGRAKEKYAMFEGMKQGDVLEDVFPELKKSEDERIRKWLIELVEEVRKANPTNAEHNGRCSKAIAWLEKQGKQRPTLPKWKYKNDYELVEQKPAWSEEDEQMLTEIVKDLQVYKSKEISRDAKDAYQNEINWLKSLRPQNRWKPSEGQLECLGYAIENAEINWSPLTNNRIYLTLKILKEQLEKL